MYGNVFDTAKKTSNKILKEYGRRKAIDDRETQRLIGYKVKNVLQKGDSLQTVGYIEIYLKLPHKGFRKKWNCLVMFCYIKVDAI